MRKSFLKFGAVLSVIALMSSTQSTTGVIDLSEKGIPVSINAPDGAVINEGIGNGMEFEGVITHVWEINKGDFSLEVSMDDDEMWQEKEDYMQDTRDFFEMEEEFGGYVLEEPNGMIVKYNYEDGPAYDFYYILVKDNHAIEFSIGLETGNYSLENMRKLYQAAKEAK